MVLNSSTSSAISGSLGFAVTGLVTGAIARVRSPDAIAARPSDRFVRQLACRLRSPALTSANSAEEPWGRSPDGAGTPDDREKWGRIVPLLGPPNGGCERLRAPIFTQPI